MLVVIFGELWMVFFIGVVVFLYQYVAVLIRNDHVWQNTSVHEGSTNQSISFDNHVSLTPPIPHPFLLPLPHVHPSMHVAHPMHACSGIGRGVEPPLPLCLHACLRHMCIFPK